ncbi:MAG: lipid-A-disaccharide synthase [Planktomarina sp.]
MKVFIIAGEASGDRLGGALMAGLKALTGNKVTFQGVGGPLMQAEGMDSLFDYSELSIMGIAEILPKYFHLKRRIAQTADAALEYAPDVMITIDSPDFCLRVAKIVKASRQIRTVHYVAPSVWAWRPGRADKMVKVIDHVLALLPFEPPYMQAAGMDCDFVGHPVTTEPAVTEDEITALKSRLVITNDALVVLPGSRKGEVKRIMPVFTQVLQDPRFARFDLIFPTFERLRPLLDPYLEQLQQNTFILDGAGRTATEAAHDRQTAYSASRAALAASGTVSLELAKAQCPMVIGYDMNWLSRAIVGRLLRTDTVTLVNLVSQTRHVPEFIGKGFQAGPIADALQQTLDDPHAQTAAMQSTMQRLGEGGEAPGLRAARAVLARL